MRILAAFSVLAIVVALMLIAKDVNLALTTERAATRKGGRMQRQPAIAYVLLARATSPSGKETAAAATATATAAAAAVNPSIMAAAPVAAAPPLSLLRPPHLGTREAPDQSAATRVTAAASAVAMATRFIAGTTADAVLPPATAVAAEATESSNSGVLVDHYISKPPVQLLQGALHNDMSFSNDTVARRLFHFEHEFDNVPIPTPKPSSGQPSPMPTTPNPTPRPSVVDQRPPHPKDIFRQFADYTTTLTEGCDVVLYTTVFYNTDVHPADPRSKCKHEWLTGHEELGKLCCVLVLSRPTAHALLRDYKTVRFRREFNEESLKATRPFIYLPVDVSWFFRIYFDCAAFWTV